MLHQLCFYVMKNTMVWLLFVQLCCRQNSWHTVKQCPVFGTLVTPGSVATQRSNISLKPGGSKLKTIPPRYLGQPSPFTHPHLLKHGESESFSGPCENQDRYIAELPDVNTQLPSMQRFTGKSQKSINIKHRDISKSWCL